MSKFKDRRIIRAKIETTVGTDAAPGNADSVAVVGFEKKQVDAQIAERNVYTGTKMPQPGIFVGSLWEVTFELELKGSGAAGTAPDAGVFYRACGMKETITGGVSAVYKNDSVDEKSATIWFKDGGDEDEWRLVGCRGQIEFQEQAGKIGIAKCTIRGHLTQLPTATAAWAPTYDATIPVPILNKPLVIGGYTFEQSEVSIDCGNELAAPTVLNTTDGFGEIRITKRAPTLKATVFPPAAATNSPLADRAANTTKTLSQAAIGGTAGNIYQFTFGGGGKYLTVDDGDTNGIVNYAVTLGLLESAVGADNELTLTFT